MYRKRIKRVIVPEEMVKEGRNAVMGRCLFSKKREKEADWEMWRMSRVGAGNAGSSQQMASIF